MQHKTVENATTRAKLGAIYSQFLEPYAEFQDALEYLACLELISEDTAAKMECLTNSVWALLKEYDLDQLKTLKKEKA